MCTHSLTHSLFFIYAIHCTFFSASHWIFQPCHHPSFIHFVIIPSSAERYSYSSYCFIYIYIYTTFLLFWDVHSRRLPFVFLHHNIIISAQWKQKMHNGSAKCKKNVQAAPASLHSKWYPERESEIRVRWTWNKCDCFFFVCAYIYSLRLCVCIYARGKEETALCDLNREFRACSFGAACGICEVFSFNPLRIASTVVLWWSSMKFSIFSFTETGQQKLKLVKTSSAIQRAIFNIQFESSSLPLCVEKEFAASLDFFTLFRIELQYEKCPNCRSKKVKTTFEFDYF